MAGRRHPRSFASPTVAGATARGNCPRFPRYDQRVPDEQAIQAEDRRRDLERSMSERLQEAVRLSRVAAELEANLRREPDVRAG